MTRQLGVRARFTLLYGIALIISVVLISGGIYFFVQRALMGQVENHLHKDSSTISDYLKHDLNDLIEVAEHGPIDLFRVWDGDRPLTSSLGWRSQKLDEATTGQNRKDPLFSVQTVNGKLYRVLAGNCITDNGHSYRIMVAHDEGPVRQTLKTLAFIILLLMPMAIVISLAIGYFIAGRVLAPISAITRKAEVISAENLSERLPVGDGNDEFSRLATVFNQTFARIEDSFARLRRFTADASHELRTPLAAIRSIGETAMHTRNERVDCREAIGSMLEETDRLTRLVDSLLTLSRTDGGSYNLNRETTDLSRLAADATDCLLVLAEEKLQTLSLEATGPVYVAVDPETMRQALINLLDNAIKYTPCNGEIRVVIGKTPEGEASLDIIDNGPGIPPEHHDKIFDRFYRVDKGRSREVGGTGLGLSIARWSVEANNGRLVFESNEGRGSDFRIVLPIATGQVPDIPTVKGKTKKMMKKSVVTVAVALLFVVLGTYSQVWAGPPFVTDDPEPVEYKHGEFYVASQFANDKGSNGSVNSGTVPQLEMNYGILPDTQLHLIVPFTYNHPTGGTTQYGIGDVELGVKYRFLHESETTPQAAVFPLVELPAGNDDKGLGEGHVQLLIPLWLQKNWGPWTTYGGVGYGIRRINPNPGDRNFWQLGWLLQREINKSVSIGAEVFHFTRKNDDEEHNRTGFNVGSIINISDDHHILLSAGRDIVGDNRFSAYVAYQLTFGPHEEKK